MRTPVRQRGYGIPAGVRKMRDWVGKRRARLPAGGVSAPLSFCLRVAPRGGFAPSASGLAAAHAIGRGNVGPPDLSRALCCPPADTGWAGRVRYGLPERFRANCAFGGGRERPLSPARCVTACEEYHGRPLRRHAQPPYESVASALQCGLSLHRLALMIEQILGTAAVRPILALQVFLLIHGGLAHQHRQRHAAIRQLDVRDQDGFPQHRLLG